MLCVNENWYWHQNSIYNDFQCFDSKQLFYIVCLYMILKYWYFQVFSVLFFRIISFTMCFMSMISNCSFSMFLYVWRHNVCLHCVLCVWHQIISFTWCLVCVTLDYWFYIIAGCNTEPHRARQSHTEPHMATPSHAEPHRAT